MALKTYIKKEVSIISSRTGDRAKIVTIRPAIVNGPFPRDILVAAKAIKGWDKEKTVYIDLEDTDYILVLTDDEEDKA